MGGQGGFVPRPRVCVQTLQGASAKTGRGNEGGMTKGKESLFLPTLNNTKRPSLLFSPPQKEQALAAVVVEVSRKQGLMNGVTGEYDALSFTLVSR